MCGRYTQWRYILVDKGAMAVREIQLSERETRDIYLCLERTSERIVSVWLRFWQAVPGTRAYINATMLQRFPGVITWDITALFNEKKTQWQLFIRIFLRVVASLERALRVIAIPKFNYNGKGTNRYGRYVYNRLRLSTAKFNQCSLILSNICTQSHPRTSQFCPTVSRY